MGIGGQPVITPAYSPTATERVLPRMALDFTTGVLDPRVTVTRALNTATITNSTGVLEIVNANLPRFDYNPTTLANRGLLIEELRSNLFINSLINGTSLTTQTVAVTAVSHTISFYGTGTITISGAATATVTGAGVYPARQTLTFTPIVGALVCTVTGSVQYAQLEVGAFATSFIPTAAASVTRNADVVSMTGANFSDWYNASEGAFYVEANVPTNVDNNTGNYYLAASDGTIANHIILAEVNGTVGQISTGGFLQFNSRVGVEPTGIVKAVLAYKTNDVILCVDGTLGTLDTSVALPTVNRLSIGARGDLNTLTFLNGNIRRVSYWPQRLINAEAQAFSK
jgi:hypothetical protein